MVHGVNNPLVMELCVGGEHFDMIIQGGHYSKAKVAKHTLAYRWCG